jgi:hypothetical protein
MIDVGIAAAAALVFFLAAQASAANGPPDIPVPARAAAMAG